MKKVLFMLVLLLMTVTSSKAQTSAPWVQGGEIYQGPATSFTSAYQNPNIKGNLLTAVVIGCAGEIVTDSSGNTWTHTPGDRSFWYATAVGGANSITVTCPSSTYVQLEYGEYAGTFSFDTQAGALGAGSQVGTVAFITLTTTTPNELVIGYGSNYVMNYPVLTSGTGFTMREAITLFFEDTIVPSAGPVIVSVTYGNAVGAYQAAVAFKLLVPPPPPITLAVSGTITFDDLTAAAFGATINVQQLDNSGNLVNSGTVTSDSTGKITGTFIVNPNLVMPGGFVTFQFSINGIGATVSQTFPVSVFQQGSTGVNLSLVLFKSVMLPKSFGAGLLP